MDRKRFWLSALHSFFTKSMENSRPRGRKIGL
ncbi:hypothetical protein X738_32170 [Mesorhizobium sp. LNHC209A00]|nr:hypothetical protein X738_32170 [Mesorhizobium sp. LNHC209A00]